MTTPLLEARNLGVGYPVHRGFFAGTSTIPVVRDVSLKLDAGETLGIVGESGCGKSTLGRALIRLISPGAGQVLWEGRDLSTFSDEELRRKRAEMQIIFQDPVAALDPRMPLWRTISRPLATFETGLSRQQLQNRAIEALKLVGLSADFADRYPHELSGGQAQRIGIARAIIGKPKLVICDEPVSALDVQIQAQVINLLMDLQEQMGLALIFISHNLAVVRHISHHVMVMCLGRVVEHASRDEFYARQLHPYSQALRAAVPEPDPHAARLAAGHHIPGEMPSILSPPKGCVFTARCPNAQDRCKSERPQLRQIANSRSVACHFVDDAHD